MAPKAVGESVENCYWAMKQHKYLVLPVAGIHNKTEANSYI
jgi:hypothetical protein